MLSVLFVRFTSNSNIRPLEEMSSPSQSTIPVPIVRKRVFSGVLFVFLVVILGFMSSDICVIVIKAMRQGHIIIPKIKNLHNCL